MENNTDITAIDNSQDQGPKPSGNPIYQFMKTNNLTDKDEKTFLNEYSDSKKAQELHTFMKDNDLTDKDSASFYDTYLKKKDGTTISGLTKLPSTSQGGNLPDFQKGLALAQKGYAMPNEGGGEQKAEGEYSNFGTNLALQGLTKAADIDIATLKFLRNLKGKLPFTDKAQEIYDENGNLTKYGQGIDNTSDYLGRAIRSFRETQIKDQHLLENQYRLPETTGGQIASGIAGIAPDLALAAMTGGKNLFSGTGTLAAIGNAVTSSFVREQAIAGAAKGYNESDNKSAGETFLNTIKEGGKGAGQGALYEIAGFGGNKLGGVIGGALKNTTAKEAVNLGARLATFSLGVPNVESLIKEGRLANQDEVLQNLGVSGAMELFHLAGKAPEALMNKKGAAVTTESNPDIEAKVATHINDVRAGSALNNFMKASPDVIDNLVKSDQTAQHLNLSAMDAVKRAESMPDGEEKSKVLQTAADFTQAADIKHVTDLIANSPDGLTHLAQDLPENIRDQFMQKAQDIHQTLNPAELQKQAHVDNISQAEDAIKQFEPLANPNNPNVKERLDAQREIDKAKATIDQATKDFNKTSDEQEQQKQALQDAKLAQQQEAPIEPTEEVKPIEGVAYHGDTGKSKSSGYTYLGDKDLAESYAEADGGKVKEVKYKLEKPFVVDSDAKSKIISDLAEDFQKNNPKSKWHPDTTNFINEKLRELGYDGLVIKKEALDTEYGYEKIGGTYGNPQIVLFPKEEVKPTEVKEEPKKTYQEVLKEKQEAEKKLNREIGAEKATVTKEVFRKVNQMGVPEDAEQIALRYLADGGKISDAAIDEAYGTVKGAELNVQRRAVKTEEVKSKDFAGGKESLNDLAHRLWEDSGQKISERDIKNALMTEIGMHNTRLEAGKSYLERYSPEYQAEQHYARIAEQAKEEWENEQKELENQLRKPLDEQIKGEASEEHINNLIKQYEAETKGENQQPRSEGEGEINKKISSGNGGEEKPTKEAKVEEPEEKTTSIKNKVTAEERANKGLDEIEVAAKRSFPEVFEKGKQLVDEGKIDPRQMAIDLAKKPRALSPEESVALLYDRMKIQKEYKKLSEDIELEPDGIVKDLMRSNLNQLEKAALINDEAAKKTGYEQGLGLAVRKMIIKEDYSLLNQKARYKAANNGEELSPEIESKLKENVTKLEESQKKLEEYEQTIKDLQAKKVIDTEAKKAKKTNKTTEDFKKEREDIFKNIKDKWDSASKTNIVTAVPVPYAAQLAAISPEVLKLVRSYAEQGITKLDDIINDLHENISKQIPDITKRDVKDILAGEYTKKKEAPPVDREKMKLQSNVNRIKNQIELDKQEILRDKRSLLRKGIDYFQGWRRFGLLSGAPVIGKIGLGAAIRTGITTPGEALIGKGLSQLPIISRIAAKAGREGTFNTKAEAKAFAQFVDKASYEDVRQVFKTGRGELENLHDKKLYPSNGWLDFFGNLHAAIKVLPKRAEYFRALEYRTEHALKNGADITDPIVQQELSAKAYADALRSIYMQDNAVTDLYKTAVRKLESLGGIGKGGAEVMKFILPIIKVPTNYVAEESSYILGGFKALFALRKGISKLSPEEADYVMRALKKQTAGVGFLMLGYARPDLVGGYYTGPRKKGDLQAGDLVVAGVHMPHWAMHTPMLEALQFGASIRRAREAAGKSYKQKDLNMFTGIVPSLGAVAKQIPFAEQAEQVTKGLKSTDAFLRYAGGQAQSVLDPQLVKNIAEFTDYSNGQWNKREAKTFMEKLQSGFPGTREQLKIKKQ
jgi:hypothetical protein